MKNGNFVEKAYQAIDEIADLTESCINDFGIVFEENFPAISYKVIEVDGREYRMKIEVSIQKIPN